MVKYNHVVSQIRQNWTETENLDICFCLIFDGYYKSFISGREPGHWAQSPTNYELFSQAISRFMSS